MTQIKLMRFSKKIVDDRHNDDDLAQLRELIVNYSDGVIVSKVYKEKNIIVCKTETLNLSAELLDDPIPLLKGIKKEKDDIFHSLLLLAGHCLAQCQPNNDPIFNQIIDELYEIWWGDRSKFAFMESTVVAIAQNHSRICQHLQSALQHSDALVRSDAAKTLGTIGNSQAVAGLIAALQDSKEYVRGNAVEALGKIGNSQAVPSLIATLQDSKEYVRYSAAEALGKISDVRILKQIVKSPKIDIFDRDIFLLARKLAIKFQREKDRVDFIPVYDNVVNSGT